MPAPLIVRLLLDAQSEFARAADAVPPDARDAAREGRNTPGWVVAHASFFHDVWLNVDARGLNTAASDPWLLDWMQRQRAAADRAIDTPFAEARLALERVIARTTPIVTEWGEADLAAVPARIEEHGWPAGVTMGYLTARAVAHLFAHAGELNVAATSAGAPDMGLPGRLARVFGTHERA